jgi:hypothetical protein
VELILEFMKGGAMAAIGDLLFYRRDMTGLNDALSHQVEQLRAKADAISDKVISDKSDDEIAQQIAVEHALAPLIADFASAIPSVRETEVEVHDSFGFGRGSARVAGLEATKAIHFTGDSALWSLHPGSWSSNPSRGEVRGDTLVIGMAVAVEQADQAAQYIEETMARLPETLAQQKVLIEQHNVSLAAQALPLFKARRQRLNAASDLLKKLGG